MGTDRRTGYLLELGHELDTHGLVARVVRTRSGPAFLRVINPDAASLAEDVTCAPAPESHDHYYWWSWGERLHGVDDPGAAAVKLAHVLQPLPAERPAATGKARSARQTRATGRRSAPTGPAEPTEPTKPTKPTELASVTEAEVPHGRPPQLPAGGPRGLP